MERKLPKKWEHLKCGVDLEYCMHCGGPLDWYEGRRKVPEPCEECINKGKDTYVDPKDGKVKKMPGGYNSKWAESMRDKTEAIL
jgi:hypothetical protein